MVFIHVLRVKCEPLEQSDFLAKQLDSVEVISQAIKAKPTADVGRGSEWHLGNIQEIEKEDAVGFAMGRTAMVTSPRFDETTHDFLEEETKRAPFTLGIFDQRHQACGIIRKPGVSQNATEIAAKLQTLLNATRFPRESNAKIIVDPVRDPTSFIEALQTASAVTRFSFYASRPNPHDVNRLIQRPAEEFTQAAGGERTKVEVEGEDLDRQVLTDLSQAVAAVGETATANVRPEPCARTKRIHLAGNPVSEPVAIDDARGLLFRMLEATREAYDRVRNARLG
ncbi:hypothetical protein [Sphingomonas jaspsi]|uniref:hypothetical protein n=1 Tax=Sphingomonas jaspsi TaxID=392409 RepID=UPI0012EB0ABE|nr:hypothetical protein [Sphingomonas jaspsi]